MIGCVSLLKPASSTSLATRSAERWLEDADRCEESSLDKIKRENVLSRRSLRSREDESYNHWASTVHRSRTKP